MDKLIAICLFIINFIGFISMMIDKRRAVKHKWRIPEYNLFFIGLLGGSLGCLVGMYTFRHKTKHWYFKVIYTLFLVVHLLILYYFLK